jgi:DNA replication protein DnaC
MERLGEALARLRIDRVRWADAADPAPDPEPRCSICRDLGFVRHDVPLDHPDFGRAFPCTCRTVEVTDRLRRRSNLGPLANRTFASFDPNGRPDAHFPMTDAARQRLRAALEHSRVYAEEPQGWLVLGGPSGCGKTHLAAAIANRQLELGHDVFFAVVPDLLDHLRATYAPSSDVTYDELFEAVRDARLLILDDLGTQTSSPWAREKLFQLFNHRFNAELPTVITTNQRLSDLDERLRARLEDRRQVMWHDVRTRDNPFTEALLGDWQPGLADERFETFDWSPDETLRDAYNKALEFAGQPAGWLVLTGDVGCGKTHLAAAIKNERDDRGEPTLFVTAPGLLDYLRATYAPSSDVTYDRGFDVVRNAPVLILDDYGAHSSTPWAEEKLFQLLNHRFNGRLPTVITTNLTLDRKALGPGQLQGLRIFSRLLDRELCKVVELKAPPYRRPSLAPRPRLQPEPRADRARGGGAPKRT